MGEQCACVLCEGHTLVKVNHFLHTHSHSHAHQVYSTGRNLGINMWWLQFPFRPEDCPEGGEHDPVVSLKNVVAKEFLQMK